MKTQSIVIALFATTMILLGVTTCSKAVYKVKYEASNERCRVNKVIYVNEYQEGRSPYPTRERWILETDEGYRVVSYRGNYRPGDSIDIEVRKYHDHDLSNK